MSQWPTHHVVRNPYIEEASPEDLCAAVRNALARCGHTAEELKQMYRDNDFCCTRARMAWVAVGDLL